MKAEHADSCKFVSATGYRVYRLVTSYTALYSCFSNWLQSVPIRYWLHSLVQLTRPNWLQSHPSQSIQLCVDSGVTSIYQILLQPTSDKVYQPGAGYTVLHLKRFTQTSSCLNSLVTPACQFLPVTENYWLQ